ncbi:hypothetical protein BBG47_26995 [Paenibacillus sp. KS1]|nr:hypothetical protein BBG47_26995 [Paenibacillus sp. KS1]
MIGVRLNSNRLRPPAKFHVNAGINYRYFIASLSNEIVLYRRRVYEENIFDSYHNEDVAECANPLGIGSMACKTKRTQTIYR